jgi:iron-sulfur cluster assembly protein
MNFFLSESAIKYLQSKNILKIRVLLQAFGCNGFQYNILLENINPHTKDNIINIDNIEVYIDPKSSIYLNGTTLDYYKSLIQSGFKFLNPNAKSNCGCGKSVSFK